MANYKVTYLKGSTTETTTLNTILVPGTSTSVGQIINTYKTGGVPLSLNKIAASVTGSSPFSQQGKVGYKIVGTDITSTYKLVMPSPLGNIAIPGLFKAVVGGYNNNINGNNFTVTFKNNGTSSSVTPTSYTRVVPSWVNTIYLLIVGSAGGGQAGKSGGGGGGGACAAYKLNVNTLPVKIVLGGGGGGGIVVTTSTGNAGNTGNNTTLSITTSTGLTQIATLYGGEGGTGLTGGAGGTFNAGQQISGATGLPGTSGGGGGAGGAGGTLNNNYMRLALITNLHGGKGGVPATLPGNYTGGGGGGGAAVQVWYYF